MKKRVFKSAVAVLLSLCILLSAAFATLSFSAAESNVKSLDNMENYAFADFASNRLFTLCGTKLFFTDMTYNTGYELFDFSASSANPSTMTLLDIKIAGDTFYTLFKDSEKNYIISVDLVKFQSLTDRIGNCTCEKFIVLDNGDVLVSLENSGSYYVFVRRADRTSDFYRVDERILDFYGSNGNTVYYKTANGLSYGTYGGTSFSQSKRTLGSVSLGNSSRPSPFRIIADGLAAANTGEVYSITNNTYFSRRLTFNRTGYTQSCGALTVYLSSSDLIVGADGQNNLTAYNSQSFDAVSSVNTSYRPYYLFTNGSAVLCVEKNNNQFYYEIFDLSDFVSIKPTVIDLNEEDVYSGRTKADIANLYSQVLGSVDLTQHALCDEGSLNAPYKGTLIDSGVQNTLVDFSSYLRWLAGLSGYTYGGDATASTVGKGAVLLYAARNKLNYTGHTPPKPSDMDTGFYNEAYSTCGGNISYGYRDNVANQISSIRALNNDIYNASNSEIDESGFHQGYNTPGHRNCFLQRGGNKITYGYASQVLLQYYEYAQSDPNAAGTITQTGNNEAAYSWPSPGYFPADEIDPDAVWTIYFNTDKVDLGNKPPAITITDLDTGETFTRNTEMHDVDGQRVGYSTTNFWGKSMAFTPPDVTDFSGKSYRVTVEHLVDSSKLPVTLTYTINFFDYQGEYTINGVDYMMDSYGMLTPVEIPTTAAPTTEEPTTEEPTTEEPTTEEPTTAEPTTEEPTEEPTTAEPTTVEPTTEEPTTEEPTTAEPTAEEPTTVEMTTAEQTTEEPTTKEPTTEEPTTDEPTTEEPTTAEPTTEEIEKFLHIHSISDLFTTTDYSIRIKENNDEFMISYTWNRDIEIDSYQWSFNYDSEKLICKSYKTYAGAVYRSSAGRITASWSDSENPISFNSGDEFAWFIFEPVSDGETTIFFYSDELIEHVDIEPTTIEPTTEEPTTEEPTTAEPTTEQPTTAEPSTAEPTTEEPTTEQPTTVPVPSCIIGDVNGDGVVDILDAMMIQKYAVDKVVLNDQQLYAADVNDDGSVDVLDAKDIQKYTVEKLKEFRKKR